MTLEIHYNVYGCFREPRRDIEVAKAAIEGGFEGIWIADHFLPWIDSRPYAHHVLPWFGALMNEISDVPIGTSVTCPMLRYQPPLLAQAFATLDNMYPGRLNLGVGVGEALNESHFIDEWPTWDTRAKMLIETLDIFDKLWNSDRYITHHGEFFDYERIRLYTQPKKDIPIHWAGWGPKSCFNAGKFSDHLLTAASAERIENQIIPNFERGLDESDRSLNEVDVTTEFKAAIGDPDILVSEIRNDGEYLPVDTDLENPDPRSIQRVADNHLAEMTDEAVRKAHNITDDPEEIVSKLNRLKDAGVTRVLVGSTCGDPVETINAFERHVIPMLK